MTAKWKLIQKQMYLICVSSCHPQFGFMFKSVFCTKSYSDVKSGPVWGWHLIFVIHTSVSDIWKISESKNCQGQLFEKKSDSKNCLILGISKKRWVSWKNWETPHGFRRIFHFFQKNWKLQLCIITRYLIFWKPWSYIKTIYVIIW